MTIEKSLIINNLSKKDLILLKSKFNNVILDNSLDFFSLKLINLFNSISSSILSNLLKNLKNTWNFINDFYFIIENKFGDQFFNRYETILFQPRLYLQLTYKKIHLKNLAALIINMTSLSSRNLRENSFNNYEFIHSEPFHIEIMSFGFKYGVPIDVDIIIDVRFLSNPFYVASLKNKTGLNKDVYDYVMRPPSTQIFYKIMFSFLEQKIKVDKKKGNLNLKIAIGCTGGQHRSVAIGRKLANDLSKNYLVDITHRDIERHKGVH